MLIAILLLAAYEDAYYAKISNYLIVRSAFFGFLILTDKNQGKDIEKAIIQLIIIFVFMYVLYLTNVFGAGDAKYLTVLRLFLDIENWEKLFFLSLIIATVAGLAKYIIFSEGKVKMGVAILFAETVMFVAEYWG